MYREDYDGNYSQDRNSEDVYSKSVRAGKRTYFFDVKATKDRKDYYLTITESKRKVERDGRFSYDKHKIFLYKEDFVKFGDGLKEAVDFLKANFLEEGVSYEQTHDNDEPRDYDSRQSGRRFTDVDFDEL